MKLKNEEVEFLKLKTRKRKREFEILEINNFEMNLKLKNFELKF